MKKIIIAFCLFTMVLPVHLWAAETTLMVKLQEKIKGNISEIGQLNKNYQGKNTQLNAGIKSTVEQLESADTAEEQEYLTKIYLRKRAEGLRDLAAVTAEMGDLTIKTMGQMERLQETMNDGDGSAISLDEKQLIGHTLAGMARQFDYFQQLDPDNREWSRMANSLKYNYAQNEKMANRSGAYSLQDQIDHMADVASTLQAALNLMDEQRQTLLANVYYVVQGSIIKATTDLMVNIDQMLVGIDGGGFDNMDAHVMDIYSRSIQTGSPSSSGSPLDVSYMFDGL